MTIFGKGTPTADRHVRRMIAAAVGLCLLVVTLQPMGVGAAPLRSVATLAGDIPLSGDWDGNGTTTIGVFRAGTWFLRNSNSPGGVDVTFSWGAPGDIPVVKLARDS